MIFYSIFLLLSVGGILAIIRRNRDEFVAFNFAEFMEGLVADAVALWHSRLRDQSFTFLEKRLREARIWVLKTESMLFRTAHKLRGIKERNGNGNNENGNNGNGGGKDGNGNGHGDNADLNR